VRILPPPTLHSFRRLHSINVGSFLTDLKSFQLITVLGPLLSAYNTTLFSLLDKHTPIVTKLSRCQSPSNPWFSTTLLQVSLQPISQAHPISQKEYYSSLISSASNNSKRLWQTVRKTPTPQILTTSSLGTSLADSFASFIHRQNIQTPSFTGNPATSSPH